jgi:anti-sigma-K factor RskA
MNCDELRDSYELYAIGVLDGPEREEIDEHLTRRCATCTEGLRKAREINSFVATLAPTVEPPPRLRKRVLASIGASPTGWSWNFAWAGAAAILFAGVLWFSIQDRKLNAQLAEARIALAQAATRLEASNSDLARVREAINFLNSPGTEVLLTGRSASLPPRGRAFVNRNRGVLLIADRLPPTGPGKIYEMWIIPKGGAPRPAGLFQSDPNGSAVHLHVAEVQPGAVVAVTVEPEAGSSAPTTTPLFVVGM